MRLDENQTVHKHSNTTRKTTQIYRSAIFGQDWDCGFQENNQGHECPWFKNN